MSNDAPFTPALFRFLTELARNNRREWFEAHRRQYEEQVKGPAQRFIVDFGLHLGKISPHFIADPRPVGGSLFRIYRDTRFSKDKSPYKTHTGLHFRHVTSGDVHAPGFYLHLEPKNVFVGAGIWHPDSVTLKKIRDAIAADPSPWNRVKNEKRFRERFRMSGDSLARPPSGYDPADPAIEDLKRKDFIAVAGLTQKDVTGPDFVNRFAGTCRAGVPLVRYLCGALGLPF